jgi:hypothetical protein
MIEFEVIDYLLTDATLKTLISWSAGDPKIYPIQAREDAAVPYLIFDCSVGAAIDELIDEDRIQITIVEKDLANAVAIRNRIKVLLDKQDEIQDTTLHTGSSNYYIYWSKLTGGTQIQETELDNINIMMYFNIKFKSK